MSRSPCAEHDVLARDCASTCVEKVSTSCPELLRPTSASLSASLSVASRPAPLLPLFCHYLGVFRSISAASFFFLSAGLGLRSQYTMQIMRGGTMSGDVTSPLQYVKCVRGGGGWGAVGYAAVL